MKEIVFQELSEIYITIHNTTLHMLQLWMAHSLFTWRWWLAIALTILPWVIWIIVRKKESTARLLFSGAAVTVIAQLMENICVSLGFWWFQSKVLPIPTTNIMWSFSLMPVGVMLFLQYKPQLNPLIKAIVLAALVSFIGLPVFSWIGMYHPVQWSNYYSFLIVIAIYLIADFIVKRSSFSRLENDCK